MQKHLFGLVPSCKLEMSLGIDFIPKIVYSVTVFIAKLEEQLILQLTDWNMIVKLQGWNN